MSAKAKAKAASPKIRATSNVQQQPSSPSLTRDGKKYKTDREVLEMYKQNHPLNKTIKGKDGMKSILRQYREIQTQTGGLTTEEREYLNQGQHGINPMAQLLMQSAQEAALAFQGTPDIRISYPDNINARINEPSNDLSSRRLPYPLQIKESIKEYPIYDDGIQQQDPFSMLTGDFTDEQPEGTLLQQQMQAEKENQIEGKILQKDNAQTTNDLQYQYGATDWGHRPINKEFTNTPYPVMNTAYYMNDGGIPSLRVQKQYLDKQSRINRPKERKNYIKTSKLMQSIAAQDRLKKHGKNKKK
ncbi:MAG: hypothetical protein EZS28_043455 [Streblomastix strix]|uniref:Uncharacterized protein n=1 Tax=Streblomastix strix TaxID=222440 RepID=A0A5J4TRX5_9EUKA|nr:MAG: hypothetical protein EZS28_043455 [Streblomastix strix]